MLNRCISLLVFALSLPSLAADYRADKKIYQAVQEAQQQLERQQSQQAMQALQDLLPQAKTPYERALVQHTLGYAALQQKQPATARQAFAAALKSAALPPSVSQPMQRTQAQLLIQAGQVQSGLQLLRRWRKAVKHLQVSDHQLFAYAYTELKQAANAAWHLQKAIQKSPQAPLAWYQQLLAAHLQAQQDDKAIKVLLQLVRLQPQKHQYWQHLAQLYMEQKQPQQALAVLALAQRKGALNADLLVWLAHLYVQQAQPLRAAQLLEQAFAQGLLAQKPKHLRLLAVAWAQARETDKAARIWAMLD